ncbi:snRNA-activating protein complex subunit 1b isoform X2 [Colossoma macropomum]|uniref:snRNA-activating protein complex subunit 1b isoform X2 n=1 Tax=Colossoma macropomum TaxID=42526 RepID=UPI0018648601|nr:snRNA-activating protein complex subunit 1b isoform X2 [Colossoma macropomum]
MEHYRRAVQTDCERILGRFQATDSVRYEEFSTIWRQMNFSSIFYGRMEHSETKAFTRLALSVVSPYLFPPYTFQIRVGGLYLLYGLYNTQLTTPKEKIRLALKDWDDLIRFQQDAVNAQHYDVVYILKKLLSEKAFCFTAMPNILFFNLKRKRGEKSQKLCDTFVDRPSRPQELVGTDMLEELSNVHEHYEKLKQAVSPQPDTPDLSLIKQNLVPKLRSAVLTYYSWQQNQAEFDGQGAESDAGAGEGTSGQESAHRAQLLQSIKSRSYGQAAEASKSRRHRQVELASAATDTTTGEVSNYKKKVLSLKERTQLRFTSQGNLNKELMGVTRLWCLTTLDEKTEEKKKRRFNWESEQEGDEH